MVPRSPTALILTVFKSGLDFRLVHVPKFIPLFLCRWLFSVLHELFLEFRILPLGVEPLIKGVSVFGCVQSQPLFSGGSAGGNRCLT